MSTTTLVGLRSNAGRKRKTLTPRQQAYIRANYNRMSVAEMANNLDIKYHDVFKYMQKNSLDRYIKPKQSKGIVHVLEGFFNVMERENWAI